MLYAYFGVNPSTADANIDDQTITKLIGFTERNGGRGFIVGNVFAFRATDVKALKKARDPVGNDNNKYLEEIISQADVLVPCWGNTKKVPVRLRDNFKTTMGKILNSGKVVKIFGRTVDQDPKHPLMLPYSTLIIDP